MYGNGVLTGMIKAITAALRRMTRQVQIQENFAFFVVAAGAAATTSVGLPIATGSIRTAGATTAAFVWFFRRTNVSPYTQFRDSGI